jgi:transposase-like protein
LSGHSALGQKSSIVVIRCRKCKNYIPLKNNEAIWHAAQATFLNADIKSCPNINCENHYVLISDPHANYKLQGKTKAGTQRWQCQTCKRTFSPQRKRRPPRAGEEPFRREDVTKMLVNGIKLNRILEVADISPTRLYQYIDKAYESCLRFNTDREITLGRAISRLSDQNKAL